MARHIALNSRVFLLVVLAIVVIDLTSPRELHAQASSLAFEVVSVKVNKPGQRRELAIQYSPGGRFSARGALIPLLILDAFDLPRLYPGPEFQKLDVSVLERDLYDIEAIAPKDAIPPGASVMVRNQKIKEMLQTLLMDRFKLRVHHEMKEQPVYAIVATKNGPKFQSGAIEQCADKPTDFFDPASCHSMADLIRLASRVARLDRPVVDKTGLTGLYSIPVDWSAFISGGPRPEPGTDPSQLFSDMLDRIGLKLESQTAVADMLLVDHVEPPTLEN
jgi:uncharacterized protein (TIGR03435 family)